LATALCHNVHMNADNICTLPQPDQLRPDATAIQSDLEFVASRIARLPTRGQLAQVALGIIFCSAAVSTLFGWIAFFISGVGLRKPLLRN
jgi:hypothetical protein